MYSPRIVILGGGFAGLEAARQLSPDQHRVTVVDPSARFGWQPNLHELISGRKTAAALSLSRRERLSGWGHAFRCAAAIGIDAAQQRVHLSDGASLPYDVLMVATGGRAAIADAPELRAHSVGLRRVSDGARIAERLRALAASGQEHRVVVMGGGFIGVEIMGELLREAPPGRRLTLIEGGDRLMAGYPDSVHRSLSRRLSAAGVEVRLSTRVAAATPGGVTLASGEELSADLVIEALGLGPPPLLASSGLASGAGWAPVRQTLQSVHHDNIFILGDSARTSPPLAKQAYHALKMGVAAAAGVEPLLRGRRLAPFEPMEEVFLVTFGDQTTFFVARGVAIEQRGLGVLRELIFQQGMLSLDPPRGSGGMQRLLRRLWPAQGALGA